MTRPAACHGSLEYLTEPALLVSRSGGILTLNPAAGRLLGPAAATGNVMDYVEPPLDGFRRFLRRCGASSSSIVGAATLKTASGPLRFRMHGAALPAYAAEDALVLRCLSARGDQFSILGRQVRELNEQLRARLRERLVLQEALSANQELLRELQHRVKNNIQMMASLIQMSARGRASPELSNFVEIASLRLQALSAAQEAIYRSEEPGAVAARPLLEELAQAIVGSFGATGVLKMEIAEARLPGDIAHALALITNELMTNALKHGLPTRSGEIRLSLRATVDGFELVVQDNGPGLPPDTEHSGLKLVRGLCRQIGGALAISNVGGARCSVQFEVRSERRLE